MIKKMMRTTVAAAGFAALLLSGACAHSNPADVTDNRVVEVRPENPGESGVVPGPALADSDGNVYSSSAAPGRGNPATVGTNTNVNNIADKGSIEVTETATVTPLVEPTITEPVVTPMTSATQETPAAVEETPAPAPEPRTRLRKD